jgi:putative phosphoserine phosphatase/1-acylglycerol-3-phosphate O-acyltransferase
MAAPTAAVFSDVEGTLVAGSLPRLAVESARRVGLLQPRQRLLLGVLDAAERLLPATWRRRTDMMRALVSTSGLTEADLARVLDDFVPAAKARLKPTVLRRLQAHQEAGLPLVLLSGGLHEAIVRLAAELGGRGEGSRVARRGGFTTARLSGPVCQGTGKAQRAREVLAEIGCDAAASYAYGDTVSDIPFLELFGRPCAVDPDPTLAAEAQRRGWELLRTR